MDPEFGTITTITGLFVGLAAIARFIWRWEKTFTDSAIEELRRLRTENEELRNELKERDRDD